MKRFAIVIAVMLMTMTYAGKASAQHRYGVIGGFTFSTANIGEINRGMMTQYHVGVTYRYKLPLGFSIQPSLIYQVKGAKAEAVPEVLTDSRFGYLELPVSVQWGPDLLLFRPYLEVSPYVGYGLNNRYEVAGLTVKNDWTGVNRWEYGVGAGIGLDVWKFQVVARYNWNLGGLIKKNGSQLWDQVFVDNANFRGLTLSVAFLF